jgi:transcription antitermination factor NusG
VNGSSSYALDDGHAAGEQWYAVWTRSQYEAKVEEELRRKDLEVFLPRVRTPSRRRDRRVVLRQPLFPGYLLLRFAPSPERYIRVASTDGVVRILGTRWDALWPVPDEQVNAVRRLVTDGEDARQVPWLKTGDRVRIAAGPLVGLEGLVGDWRPGRATFVVSVDILQRSVAVELDPLVLDRI